MVRKLCVRILLCAAAVLIGGLFVAHSYASAANPPGEAAFSRELPVASITGPDYALLGLLVVGLVIFLLRPRRRVPALLPNRAK